jgi:aryl-alcohol dehydrogenase-like predicted oxidoreductase
VQYRRLGRSGLEVGAIALGTVELGMDYGINAPGHYGRPHEDAAIRLVHRAVDAGINLIDTARAYGESEAVLGKALEHRRGQVILATKVSTRLPDGSMPTGEVLRLHMLGQLETSLKLLQTDYVDLWQLHSVDDKELAQRETIAAVFDEVKRSGKVGWVGGSFYGAEWPAIALGYNLFDTIQVTYSVFDQRLADHVFALASAHDAGILVRSVLLKGALTERADHLPDHLEPLRARSRRYRQLVQEAGLGLSPAQVALVFALAQPQIGAALVGVRSEEELQEHLQAVDATLPADLMAQLTALRTDDELLLNPGLWGVA